MKQLKLIVLTACLLLGWPGAVSAQSKPSQTPHGITVTPAYQQLQIKADEAEHHLSFSITNHRPTTESLKLSVRDFNTLNETGGLFFVGTKATELQKKYGLARWLALDKDQINIAPNQTVEISARVLNQGSLSPGGHYGAMMLSIGADRAGSQPSNIAVQPIASALLFVTKLGGDTHRLKLEGVSAERRLFKLPDAVDLRFYNNGNTHVIPRGRVTVTRPDGVVVSQGIINEDSNLVLPETYRRLTVRLQPIAPVKMAGRYKLTVDFRFEGYAQFRRYQSSFYVMTTVVWLSLALLLGLTAAAGKIWWRWYKKPLKAARTKSPHSRS